MAVRKKKTVATKKTARKKVRAKKRASRPAPRPKRARAAVAATKPRAAASVARTFEMLLNSHGAAIRELAARLRELVRDALPDAEENIYGGASVGMALYSIGGQNRVVCGIQPVGNECLFYVHNVLPDDTSSLVLEGKGQHSLHVRLRSLSRDERAALHALVRLSRERLLA